MDRKRFTGTTIIKADAPEGSVTVQFSTLDAIDADMDVTRPGAFGTQEARLTPYGHDMQAPSIGKGTITEDGRHAIFEGAFFLKMHDGREAYESVKGLGPLQEWSYEFNILKASEGQFEDQPVRFLESLEVFGVSPVYRGAGVDTQTLAIKGEGIGFADHGLAVASNISEYLKRVEARVAMRAREDRTISADDRSQLDGLVIQLAELRERLAEALKVPEHEAGTSVESALMRFRAITARINGVPLEV